MTESLARRLGNLVKVAANVRKTGIIKMNIIEVKKM